MAFIPHLRKLDWKIIFCVFSLSAIGLAEFYSISSAKGDFLNLKKQMGFVVLGFILIALFSFFNWRAFKDNPYFILVLYFICLLLLAGLFFVSQTRGTKSWYKFDLFSFDPVEPMKLILIILFAKYFSMRHIEMYKLRHILLTGLYALLPALLVALQPNLGSAIILVSIWVGILLISGIKIKHFLILILCGIVLVSSAWFFFLKDYQKARIISFVVPEQDPLGASWNQSQAKIAIGSGGIFGKGFMDGSQARYGFLPEAHTDFIFATVSEEFGFVGAITILALFLFLIWRIIRIATVSEFNFQRLFASGLAIVIISQVFINIGMNLGLLPVIGVALPFVSYGGSGFITLCIGLGILQSTKLS
jgi:rod shape determining protein RodA